MTPWVFRNIRYATVTAALAVLAAACSSDSPSSPGGGGGSGGGPGTAGPIGATITIQNGRMNPSTVTVTVGQSVNFVNSDGRSRNVSSDPHPDHNQCTAMNVGNLNNGQTRPTGALTVVRTCGFHDHDQPDDANLKGSVVIVAAGGS